MRLYSRRGSEGKNNTWVLLTEYPRSLSNHYCYYHYSWRWHIVHTDSHSHFIARIIEALGLTIHGNGSRYGDTIGILLYLNRALVCCSALEASAKWPFKGGLETLCQESEERIGRCGVR